MLTESGIKAAIRHAPASGRAQTVIKDAGPRGSGRLALVVRPLATRVSAEWYAIYFRTGKRALGKIGTYPELSLAEAREKFRNEYAPTILAGAEPRNRFARRNNRKGAGTGTVRQLFEAYVADLRERGAPSAYAAERALLKREGNAAKVIGPDRPACEISPADIIPFLAGIYDQGTRGMALVARTFVGSAFRYGLDAENDYRKRGEVGVWGLKYNPVSAIPTDEGATKPRQRFLRPSEFLHFWRWCEANDDRFPFCPLLRLNLATGQRIVEMVRLSERSHDPVERTIDWSKTKNGLPHFIPTPRQAEEIIDRLRANKHGLYFPHKTRHSEPALPGAANNTIIAYLRENPGVEHFIARDIRRTWKTLAGRAGISKEDRDRIQNHAIGDISSKHYDRYSYFKEKRAAMARWERFLDRILRGEAPEEEGAD